MAWNNILNHDAAFERFRRTLHNNRLASTYLFVGPDGIGKRTFALKLAQALLCENIIEPLIPCETCSACQQVVASTHPDLILISKPVDKAFIPLETFIGDAEHRRQRGLCHEIGLKPFRGGRKIAIIDDADFLNIEGANSLLKTLEEPPPESLIILLGSSEQRQLSTIVSRSQIVRFEPLSTEQVATIMANQNLETAIPVAELAAAAQGSIARAIALAEEEVYQFRVTLINALASLDPGRDNFGKEIVAFVEAAGKDTAKRRARLHMAGDFSIEFFELVLRAALGHQSDDQLSITPLVSQAIERLAGDAQTTAQVAAECIERTILMQEQIKYNASPINIVLPWLKDLASGLRGGLISIA
jgi:DNA polymerase-3 subunit delta'